MAGDAETRVWLKYLQEGVEEYDWQASVDRKNETQCWLEVTLATLATWNAETPPAPGRRPEVELMPDKRLLVSVVDDDESVRESLPDLLNEFGYSAQTFSSALEFLASDALERSKCLILDIAMPGMNGIELQAELKRHDKRIPIIFITAMRDDAVRARVVELGAAACLLKPFSDTALLDALRLVMPSN